MDERRSRKTRLRRGDMPCALSIHLPAWVGEMFAGREVVCAAAEDRMRLAIELSRRNVEQGTGGPFGAAVFERDSGRLIAAGVNLVVASGCCVSHAEIVAIMLAQQALASHDLGAAGLPVCELATSTEPCAMCLGAIPWSGIRSVLCGADGADALSIGFDEGDKPPDWPGRLEARGIHVTRGVLRDEAAGVLRQYANGGGEIYNGRAAD
jgi:tRNA(Arg) A34 adenosine deaminase TadA